MNINELEKLAKAATPGPWLCDWPIDEIEDENEPADVSVWQRELFSGKFVNNVCSDNAIVDGNYIAAANPSAIIELIAAYLEAVDALREARTADDSGWCQGGGYITEVLDEALDTAKRLGVE